MSFWNDIWFTDSSPCGRPVFCTEMSTWAGAGCPDPVTNRPIRQSEMKLQPKWVRDELAYFVGLTPSGAFVRIFND